MDDFTVKIVALVRAQISLTAADKDFRRYGTDRQRRNLIIASDSYAKAIVVPVKDSNRQETWCEEICTAPLRKGGEPI